MKQKLTKRQKGYKRPSRKKVNPNSAKEKEIRKVLYQLKKRGLRHLYRGDKNTLRKASLSDLRATTNVLKQKDKPISIKLFTSRALSLSKTKYIENNKTFYNQIIDIENETNKLLKEYKDKLTQVRETKLFKDLELKEGSTKDKKFKKDAIRKQVKFLKLVKTEITKLKSTTEKLNKVDKNNRHSDEVLKKRIYSYAELIQGMSGIVAENKMSVERQYRYEKRGTAELLSMIHAPEKTKLYLRKEEYARYLNEKRKHMPDYYMSFEEFNEHRDNGTIFDGVERHVYIDAATEEVEKKIKRVAEKYGWDSDEVKNLKIKLGQEIAEHD